MNASSIGVLGSRHRDGPTPVIAKTRPAPSPKPGASGVAARAPSPRGRGPQPPTNRSSGRRPLCVCKPLGAPSSARWGGGSSTVSEEPGSLGGSRHRSEIGENRGSLGGGTRRYRAIPGETGRDRFVGQCGRRSLCCPDSWPSGKFLPPIAAGKGWPCRFAWVADAFDGGKQVARDLRTSPRSRKFVWLGCRETGRCGRSRSRTLEP
jgi:hypothetical protein